MLTHARTALDPTELRHHRYLDAAHAFRPRSGLDALDGEPGGGAGGASGGGGEGGGSGEPGGEKVPDGYAKDTQGRSLGYPAGTPVAEMADKEQTAYWKHQAKKHQGRFDSLVGDRSYDETKAALDEHGELKKAQQTPAEQQLSAAREEGKKAGIAESNTKAATAIFRAALKGGGLPDNEVTELVESLTVARYIGDNGEIDTDGLTTFAARFRTDTSGGDDSRSRTRTRDFGGGDRGTNGGSSRGARGQAALQKRHGVKPSSSTGS